MIVVLVPPEGGEITVENLTHRVVFADLERLNGAQVRLLLQPREVRRIPARGGQINVTHSPGVLVR